MTSETLMSETQFALIKSQIVLATPQAPQPQAAQISTFSTLSTS